LGARLKLKPLSDWAHLELNGYPDGLDLPPYRPRVYTNVLGTLVGPGGSRANRAPLAMTSVPDSYAFVRDYLFWTEVRQGVPEIEALLASGNAEFQIPWPR
jgi:hypothetical protein